MGGVTLASSISIYSLVLTVDFSGHLMSYNIWYFLVYVKFRNGKCSSSQKLV